MLRRTVADEPKQNLVALRARREQVIQLLTERFSDDVLDLDEFDRRIALAHKASSVAALEALVDDLAIPAAQAPGARSTALAQRPSKDELAQLEAHRPDTVRVVAILGGTERLGQWRVPRQLKVVTVMGGAILDFRDVVLPPGTTRVKVFAFLGSVEIIVPPGLAVESGGSGIMGGIAVVDRAPTIPDPDQPLLHIDGLAIMGGITVETRLPGETERDARKRRRRELKENKRKQKQLASGR